MNLSPKNNFEKLNQFLFNEIDLNLYKYKFLNEYVKMAKEGLAPHYDLSVLNISGKGWILILHGDVLLVYGENWTEHQIHEISKSFDLNKFTNFKLSGDYILIEKLIEFYDPKNTQIEKRRILYKSTKINTFKAENLKIRIGSIGELLQLALMLQEYYHEEYKGLNDKTIEEMQQRIFSMIQQNKIYILLDKDESILSFCTIIDPDIGIMFTKQKHRNKGFAKIILFYCAQLLKDKNDTVYIMTDKDEAPSNIVCEAVGFKPYYDYVTTKINCD